MKLKYLIFSVTIAIALWSVQSCDMDNTVSIGYPVRVYARDIETEVYGIDYGVAFKPGIYTGGLVNPVSDLPSICPEDIFLETLDMMERCVEAEARNQGLEGKRMVADVILNRVNDPDFPDTIQEVITQPNQFTSYWNGAMENVEPTEETRKAVRMELEEISYPGLLYFTSEGFSEYGTPWKKVGDHYFSKK